MDLTISDAAKALGVDASRARRLVTSGDLPGHRTGRQWFVSSEEVARLAARRRRNGRPMAPARAWALLDLLDSGAAEWLSPVARSQTRAIVRGLDSREADADRWRALLRARSAVVGIHGHPAAIARLLGRKGIPSGSTVLIGGSAAAAREGVDLVALHELPEVYVRAEGWPALMAALRLSVADVEPDLRVRLPRDVWPFAGRDRPSGVALAADLLESAEPRAVSGGLEFLRQHVERALVSRSGSR